MSRIVEGLRKGEVVSAALRSILDQQVADEPASQPVTEPAPVPASTRASEHRPESSPDASSEPRFRSMAVNITGRAPLLPFDDVHWCAGEQYRMIRIKIQQNPARPKVILITSANPLDGKTVTAINIAGALALKNDGATLLIDGDLRRGSVHTSLGLPGSPGLREVLDGHCLLEDAIVRTEQLPNLYVLPNGDNQRHASELLDSSNWRNTIANVRARFSYVVLDSPPLAAVADYDLLQEVVDGVIVVARPDHSHRKLLFDALKAVPRQKMLGVVLNCAEDWFLRRSYEYGGYYR